MSKETSLQKEFMPEYVMQEQTKEQVRILAAANVQGSLGYTGWTAAGQVCCHSPGQNLPCTEQGLRTSPCSTCIITKLESTVLLSGKSD